MKLLKKDFVINSKIRNMCIDFGYYTRGTNSEYDNLLFNICNNGFDPVEATCEKVLEIAYDIYYHSDFIEESYRDYSKAEIIQMIAYNIFNQGVETRVLIEE